MARLYYQGHRSLYGEGGLAKVHNFSGFFLDSFPKHRVFFECLFVCLDILVTRIWCQLHSIAWDCFYIYVAYIS